MAKPRDKFVCPRWFLPTEESSGWLNRAAKYKDRAGIKKTGMHFALFLISSFFYLFIIRNINKLWYLTKPYIYDSNYEASI